MNDLASSKTRRLLDADDGRSSTDVLTTDLFSAFNPAFKFDLVLFNPPYVPTDDDELERALLTRDISAAWAGGADGRFVIDKFLTTLPQFLSADSLAYVILLHGNKPEEVADFAARLGLISEVVMRREAGIERLYVLRLSKFVKISDT